MLVDRCTVPPRSIRPDLEDDMTEQCAHPERDRGQIMSVFGPVNICTWCMTRLPDDDPDPTIGQGIRLEDVRDQTAGDLGITERGLADEAGGESRADGGPH